MRCNISNIIIKSKTEIKPHFTWLQRLAIKRLKIELAEIKHYVDFYIAISEHNYLSPGMTIVLSADTRIMFRVLSVEAIDNVVHVSSSDAITDMHIRLLKTSKECVAISSLCSDEVNFKRVKYNN